MELKLQRALAPDQVETAIPCGVCEVEFTLGSVNALTYEFGECLAVCLECVEYLHERNPERHPSRVEVEELRSEYPEPVWPNTAAMGESEKRGEYWPAWDRSFLVGDPV